jgi:uncharacterized phiE125 gp8 family phage protein
MVVTAPTSEPLDVDEAKTHLRVDHNDDDVWIDDAIRVARERLEHVTGRALLTQTLEAAWDAWPGTTFTLPRPPLVSVTSIKYTDRNGVEATVSSGDYLVDTRSEPGRVALKTNKSWPAVELQEVNGVVVRYVAGWTAGTLPREMRQAMLLWIGDMYENRENSITGTIITTIPSAAERLILKHRIAPV